MTLSWLNAISTNKMTVAELITQVRLNFDEDDEDIVSDTQLIVWFNAGLREICSKAEIVRDYCETDCDGSAYYELPDELTKVKTVIYIQSTSKTRMKKASTSDAENIFGIFSIEGNRIYVYGNPLAGSIRIYANKFHSALSTTADKVNIDGEAIELLSLYCEWRYWKRKRVMNEMLDARKLYDEELKRVALLMEQKKEHGVIMYGKPSTTRR